MTLWEKLRQTHVPSSNVSLTSSDIAHLNFVALQYTHKNKNHVHHKEIGEQNMR
jgi:hypothetical protein